MLIRKMPMVIIAVMLISFTTAVMLTANMMNVESKPAFNEQVSVEISPVEQFRTDREQLRAMEKAQLNDIIHDTDADADIVKDAKLQLMELCSDEEKELTVEGILMLRGFADPVVTVRRDSVNVLIGKDVLTQQECAVIMELVCRECSVDSGNVKIIPIAIPNNSVE